ncbi:MAG: hypothetical protein ACRDIB_14860, partial [Ardenticatenaceae bacterium]
VGILLAFVVARNVQPSLFVFYPYPRLTAPPFDPIVGLLLLALALPGVLGDEGRRTEEDRP